LLTGLKVGRVTKSDSFIVHTNNDRVTETSTKTWPKVVIQPADPEKTLTPLETIMEESESRRVCMQEKWDKLNRRHAARLKEMPLAVKEEMLKEWVEGYPVCDFTTTSMSFEYLEELLTRIT